MTMFLQIDVLLILELSAWAVIFIIPGIIISNYIRNRKKEKISKWFSEIGIEYKKRVQEWLSNSVLCDFRNN